MTPRAFLSTLGLCLAAHTARAQTEAIRIEYQADPGCPLPAEFVAQVLRRASSARLASPSESARRFEISIVRRGVDFAGSLVVRNTSEPAVAREVTGSECDEVAEALVLSTVLAIDPTAQRAPAASAEDTRSTASAPADRSSANDPEPEAPREPLEKASPAAREVDPPASAAAPGFAYGLSIGPQLQSGSAPTLALGVSAALEAQPRTHGLLGGLALELAFLQTADHRTQGAASSFRFFLARPKLCGVAARLGRAVSLGPCVGAQAGVVVASGAEISVARTERRFWAAAEIPIRLQLEASKSWIIQLEAGAVMPLTRYRYVFQQPETSIYEVPALGFAGGLKLGTRL
jgi:hypothetical protein